MKLEDLNLKDEPLNRTIKETRERELPWYACFFLLLILVWVPYFIYDNTWLLLLPVMVIPLIHAVAKKHERQTKALFDALPVDSQEEFKRRGVYIDQMQKKYAQVIIPIMILWCVGFFLWAQRHFEKREQEMKDELMLRMQQQQQRNTPAPK